jgi:ABC-type amino acid transport system permease subunit
LVLSQGSLDDAWATIRGLPLIVQIIVWLLFLPVMAGLWIWETTWPLVVRVLLIVSLAGWNLLVFLPRALQAARP